MDRGSGVRREGGEEFRDAGERGARLKEVVLGADFGGPFVISDGQLRPIEELEHAPSPSALLLCLDAPW